MNITRGVNPNSDGVKVFFWVYKTPENVEFRPRSCVEFFHVHFFFKEKEWNVICWWRSNPAKVAPGNLLESVNDVVDQLEQDVVHQQNQPCTDAGGPPIGPLSDLRMQTHCKVKIKKISADINIARMCTLKQFGVWFVGS